jgi:magnesium transporter
VRVLTQIDRDELHQLLAREEFFWLDLTAPRDEDLERLRHELDLEPPPAHESGTRRRLFADHERYVALVFRGADLAGDRIEPFDVSVYISGDFVVTYHEAEVEELERLRRRLTHRGGQDEQLAVARVLDAITDSFVTVLSSVDEQINEIEDEVIERPRGRQLTRIASLQRELLKLRRIVNPQRDMLMRSGDEIADLPGLEPADKDYLHEVADYLARISEQIDHFADLLTSATDIYLSRVSNQLNDIMKRLTIVATIFLPLTFVTGFFGQNFGWMVDHIGSFAAFLGWGIGGLLAAVAGMLVLFRRRGYL